MSIAVTGIEKKGPVIICSTNDSKNRVYKLDFQNGKIYGITGKLIQSTSSIVDKIPGDIAANNVLYSALYVFTSSSRSQILPYYGIVESLISYPDLINGNIDTSMISYLYNKCNGKLPKGYVAWCRGNNKEFSSDTLKDFLDEQMFKQWPQSLADSVKRFYEGVGFDLVEATGGDKELCAALLHITNNSLKRYEIQNLVSHLRGIIAIVKNNPQLRPYMDETKNAKTAHQILDDVMNKERNSKILANESKITALNGVTIGDIIIKVPSTMADFTDEGEQQHNCVGYYYHDAVASGDTLIYFLRRVDNPNKSYITCRYRLDRRETVEYRLQNNYWFDGETLINEIDRLINTIFNA